MAKQILVYVSCTLVLVGIFFSGMVAGTASAEKKPSADYIEGWETGFNAAMMSRRDGFYSLRDEAEKRCMEIWNKYGI